MQPEATIADLQRRLARAERRAAECEREKEAAHESEARLRTLFDAVDEGLAVVEMIYDDRGEIVDMIFRQVNSAYERQGGIYDVVGRSVREMLPRVEPVWLDRYKQVARTGEPIRVVDYQRDVDRWFDVYFSRVDKEGHFVAIVFRDITTQKRAEKAEQENAQRQHFLLSLSDDLRAQTDAGEIERLMLGRIADELELDRAYITTSDYEKGETTVPAEVRRGELPSLAGVFRHADYPESSQMVNEGTFVVDDVATDANLSDHNRRSFEAFQIGAVVGVGLRKGSSDIFWTFAAAMTKPRKWAPGEVQFLEQVAERTWAAMERSRSEMALRESEERFQQFAKASAAGLWIRDAASLEMEFVSPAVEAIYGTETDALLGDAKKWAAMIVPEDRDSALKHLEAARAGETAQHEFRIQRPSDGAFRWIRNTDFPLQDGRGIDRVGGIAEDITETRQLMDHQGVLLAELQHRVRNIMGMIRSMANRTASGAKDIEDYRSLLEGRLLALARVQALLTRQANVGGSLCDIVYDEVAAQAHGSGQFELVGADTMLAPKAVEVLTLAFHELATNALKYGALSVPGGRLMVTWAPFEKRGRIWLGVDWVETGAPVREPSTRKGFGSELIEARIPYELGGIGRITIEPEGARCRMEYLLKQAESILETDAPLPTTVFGGTLDMTGAADLTGRTVLVVEDDYYMARDTVAALAGAGAEVLGPCPSEDATFDLLEDKQPTHAVLDLNLGGGGPQFAIALDMKRRGVPFIFLTGYDPDVIPPELSDVPRLQKPVPFHTIVDALAQL